MSHPLELLITKLNETTRRAAEQAVVLCKQRGHHEVDIEHLMLALLAQPANDLLILCRHADVSVEGLVHDLEAELTRFPSGSSRPPVFSVHVPVLLEQAWLVASLSAPAARVRSGHLLLAWLTEPTLAQLALRSARRLAGFNLPELKHRLTELTASSPEAPANGVPDQGGQQVPAGASAEGHEATGRTPALDRFTTNLTLRAQEGKLDPVIGREAEIRQVMDILLRRRQNNPILTGEAGVGKTAVVEGLALRVACGDVPPALVGVAIHVLDMGLLQAGASVKGEFENRLKNVIDEVRKSPHPIILFIDEAHTLIGAGGQAGGNDAANLLKPALARGELRTIAATTWSEYKQHVEKDAALTRRFQVVKIDEPSEAVAAAMLRGMAPLMAQHFGVQLLDEAITEAVRLSARYISGRQLPDKAVSLLDTACARVALGQSATPARVEDARKRIEHVEAELAALRREHAAGLDGASLRAARIEGLDMARQEMLRALSAEEARWAQERSAVQAVLDLRHRGAQQPGGLGDEEATELARLQADLRGLQGDQPLVPLQVDEHVVADIVSAWTGVPLGKMVADEIETVRHLHESLRSRVIGQDHALEAIAQRVRTARAGLEDPDKPRGVFLFVGPSGVGKTETALALADVLYGGERNLITINMSEYQEAHSVSGLKGAPPGYVGHGQGGVLTEAVRRKPYSVVLLDEVEKAHPDVLEMFFQVFDKGRMDDAEGREIDFRQTLIILTSNTGSHQVMQACMHHDEEAGGLVMKAPEAMPDAQTLAAGLRPVLHKVFKPAFLGRTLVVPYYPLHDDVLAEVVRLKLARIAARVKSNHQAELTVDESLIDAVLARCTEVDTGARAVDHILNGALLPEVAEAVLAAMAEGRSIERISVGANEAGEFWFEVN
jgi:type VI secretion system protein VasG